MAEKVSTSSLPFSSASVVTDADSAIGWSCCSVAVAPVVSDGFFLAAKANLMPKSGSKKSNSKVASCRQKSFGKDVAVVGSKTDAKTLSLVAWEWMFLLVYE